MLSTNVENFQTGSLNSKLFLFGDFNCHHATWLSSTDMHGRPKTNSAGVSGFTFCQTTGLVNLITGNTFLRNRGNAESTLNLMLTNSPEMATKLFLAKCFIPLPYSSSAKIHSNN